MFSWDGEGVGAVLVGSGTDEVTGSAVWSTEKMFGYATDLQSNTMYDAQNIWYNRPRYHDSTLYMRVNIQKVRRRELDTHWVQA